MGRRAIDALGKAMGRRADVADAVSEIAERERDRGLREMARRLVAAAVASY